MEIRNINGKVLFKDESTTIKKTIEAAVKVGANLTDANLHGANLTRANLTGADLTRANLTRADLTDANLHGADLTDANLHGAALTGADLTWANLTGADLTWANLTRADLTGANLTRADLEGANLKGAILKGAILTTGESWETYLRELLPALLTAGGKPLAEVATREIWSCHTWGNCPMSVAFGCQTMDGVPVLLRPRAEQFIQFFDNQLVPLPS